MGFRFSRIEMVDIGYMIYSYMFILFISLLDIRLP